VKVAGRVRIAAAATWLPPGRSRASDAVRAGVLADIDSRESLCHEVPVADGLAAWEMALRASSEALSETRVPVAEVDFLGYAGMSATEEEPVSPVHRLARVLGVDQGVAVGVNQMSSGGDAALQIAITAMLAEADTRNALVCTGMNTEGLPYDRWRTAPEAILGDGGTAVLLSPDQGPLLIRALGRSGCAELETAFPRFHPFRPIPAEIDSESKVLDLLGSIKSMRATVARAVERALADAELAETDRIKVVCVPRTRPRTIQQAVRVALPEVLRDRLVVFGQGTGHLGPGDTLANLTELMAGDQLADGDAALLIGLGAGFTANALVVERC
jgi:3-oxoacyl-[acyl-carrier-protein] synthase-3